MKRYLLRSLGITAILWGAGVYAVNNRSYALCTPETGFTSLMHKVLFAPTAKCAVTPAGACTSAGANCSIGGTLSPSGGNTGKCTNVTVSGHPSCACQAPPA